MERQTDRKMFKARRD